MVFFEFFLDFWRVKNFFNALVNLYENLISFLYIGYLVFNSFIKSRRVGKIRKSVEIIRRKLTLIDLLLDYISCCVLLKAVNRRVGNFGFFLIFVFEVQNYLELFFSRNTP